MFCPVSSSGRPEPAKWISSIGGVVVAAVAVVSNSNSSSNLIVVIIVVVVIKTLEVAIASL